MKSNKLLIILVLLICVAVYFVLNTKPETSAVENRLTSSGLAGSDYVLDIERDLETIDVDNL